MIWLAINYISKEKKSKNKQAKYYSSLQYFLLLFGFICLSFSSFFFLSTTLNTCTNLLLFQEDYIRYVTSVTDVGLFQIYIYAR